MCCVGPSGLPEKEKELNKHGGMNGGGISPCRVRHLQQKVRSIPSVSGWAEGLGDESDRLMVRRTRVTAHRQATSHVQCKDM